MKKLITLIIMIILVSPLKSLAINIPGYEGGIQNETTYKEVIFITGEPIVMEGTLSIKRKEKDNTVIETYKYNLENKSYNAELKRDITLLETLETKGKQTTSTKTLEKYKEKVEINGKEYEVEDDYYQWNQGSVTHTTPLLGYYAGDYIARKTYSVEDGEAKVVVETVGNLVGYNSPWSSTETQTVEYIINYDDKLNNNDSWEGTATVETSYGLAKDYSYQKNIPNHISFRGGYRISEKEESVLKYKYNLPRKNGNKVISGRNLGTSSLSLEKNPNITRLNIPALRDVLGHKYEDQLLLLASMEGIPLNSISIDPSSEISRGEFARLLIKSMNVEIEETQTNSRRSSRRAKEEEETRLFEDVGEENPNFKYIEEVGKRGIMGPLKEDNFYPNNPVSKLEAYIILVRILGFEHLAPIGNYSLGYIDEDKVPVWAKDSIYVAKELDFIEGSDYLYPDRTITKGEASALIVDLIDYMREELKYSYREDILNN